MPRVRSLGRGGVASDTSSYTARYPPPQTPPTHLPGEAQTYRVSLLKRLLRLC